MSVRRLLALILLPVALTACGSADDYVERMATEHAHDEPVASPMTDGTPEGVTGRAVVYSVGGGMKATGYLAVPDGETAGLPGVVVIHEWWGLNDNIRAMTEKLAAEGYAALAVDLYGGNVASTPAEARTYLQTASSDMAAARANLTGAYAYLADSLSAVKIGSIGWCFGGGMSLETALALPADLDAAVIYYGRTTADEATLRPLQVPVLGIFGAEDGGIPVEGVRAFETAMKNLGKEVDITVYEGASHGFANPSGTAYQADAAQDAWARTLAFFNRHLKG